MLKRTFRERISQYAPWALLAALVALPFVGTLQNGLVHDDPWITVDNPFVQSWRQIPALLTHDMWRTTALDEPSRLYRPVFMLSILANRLLRGNSAASYHAGSILAHVAAVLLLWRLLLVLEPKHAFAAWCGALWFGVLPINVEAVAWVAARCDVLGAAFIVAALLANRRGGRAGRVAAVLCCAGALFSKESFVFAPSLIVLDDLLLIRRSLRSEYPKYVGLIAAVATYFLARALVGVPSASIAGATGLRATVEAFLALAVDLGVRSLVPYRLDHTLPYAPLPTWAALLVVVLLVGAGGAILWRLRSGAPGTHAPRIALALAWFVLGIVPTAIVVPDLMIIGDRYAYFPAMGLSVFVTVLLGDLFEAAAHSTLFSRLAPVLPLCGAGVLAATTVLRVPDWRDDSTLALASLRDDPDNPAALRVIGQLKAQDQRWEEARALLTRSAALEPREFRTHNALCFVLLNQGELPDAELECRRSLALLDTNPRTWVNLASVYVRGERWEPCLDAATRAVELKERYPEAHYLRAVCLANLGRFPEAVSENRTALALDPSHAGARSLDAQFRARSLLP